MTRRLAAALIGVWALTGASGARAQSIATCVEVHAEGVADSERGALRSLIDNEIGRHRSHVVSREECSSELVIELLELEGHRYVTGRINWQVPQRVEVSGTLEEAITELVTILLHNDPVRLRRPEQDQGLSGALHRLRHTGNTVWELELGETSGWLDGRLFGLATVGLGYRRELAQFSLGARVTIASRTSPRPERLAPMGVFGLFFQLRYYASADAETSAYLGAQLGIEHQWLHGPVTDTPGLSDSAFSTGLALGLRLGVELLRTADTRLDLFVLGNVPAFLSRDQERQVVNQWLPTLTAGVGLEL